MADLAAADGRDDARHALARAIVDLSEHRPVNKITVVDIAARAGLSVRTFYNHFADKYQLIGWIFSSQLQGRYEEVGRRKGSYYDFQLWSMRDCARLGDFYRNALTNTHGRDSIRVAMFESSTVFFSEQALRLTTPPSAQFAFTMRFFEMAISSSITNWLEAGTPDPPETIARWICEAIPDDIKCSIAPAGVSREQWLAMP